MEKISVNICKMLIKSNIIKQKYEDIYLYGMRNMLMKGLVNTTMLIIGIFFKVPVFTLFFYISYSVIRAYYGGYHAKSRGICFVYSNLIFVMDILFSKYLYDMIPKIILTIIFFSASIVFQIFYYRDKKVMRFLTAGNLSFFLYKAAEYLEIDEVAKALFAAVISGLFLYLVNYYQKGRMIPAEG